MAEINDVLWAPSYARWLEKRGALKSNIEEVRKVEVPSAAVVGDASLPAAAETSDVVANLYAAAYSVRFQPSDIVKGKVENVDFALCGPRNLGYFSNADEPAEERRAFERLKPSRAQLYLDYTAYAGRRDITKKGEGNTEIIVHISDIVRLVDHKNKTFTVANTDEIKKDISDIKTDARSLPLPPFEPGDIVAENALARLKDVGGTGGFAVANDQRIKWREAEDEDIEETLADAHETEAQALSVSNARSTSLFVRKAPKIPDKDFQHILKNVQIADLPEDFRKRFCPDAEKSRESPLIYHFLMLSDKERFNAVLLAARRIDNARAIKLGQAPRTGPLPSPSPLWVPEDKTPHKPWQVRYVDANELVKRDGYGNDEQFHKDLFKEATQKDKKRRYIRRGLDK
jgi:hypothetical protein